MYHAYSAEETARKYSVAREAQDDFAIEYYRRAAEAWSSGSFKNEIAPVTIKDARRGDTQITEDEEYKNIKLDKVKSLRPVFQKENGTVTAANASSINDGASAVVVATQAKIDELSLKPIAKILCASGEKWFQHQLIRFLSWTHSFRRRCMCAYRFVSGPNHLSVQPSSDLQPPTAPSLLR